MAWSTAFEDPIPLPNGRQLVTLEDAARYIQKLKKAERDSFAWQTAGQILIDAAEGRDFLMHARIGMLRAINHGKPKAEKEPRRKAAKRYTVL